MNDPLRSIETLQKEHVRESRALHERAAWGVYDAFVALGLPELRAALGVAPKYEALLDELVRIGVSDGWLAHDRERLTRVGTPSCPRPGTPSTPHARLLGACLAQLVPVLRGEIPATAVLFPKGLSHLVEPIFSGTPVADFFNERTAEAVERAVAERVAGGARVRLLEIGAGTGGTSRFAFERLRPYADRIAYTYTDISRAFFAHAMRYREEAPYLTMALLDIDRDLEGQDVTPGQYDIVIAANVLHATRNIRRTLKRVAALTRPGGVLVLNEIAETTRFATLTFGLMDGWWAFQDAGSRLPGSPGLSTEQWTSSLRASGFAAVRSVAGEKAAPLGQQVLTAIYTPATDTAPELRPATEAEAHLADWFSDVLGVDTRRRDAHFFELGGDDRLAERLLARIQAEYAVDVSRDAFMGAPTVQGVAASVDRLVQERCALLAERLETMDDAEVDRELARLTRLSSHEPEP